MYAIFVYQSFCWLRYEDQTLAFLSIYNIHAVYSKCYSLKSSQDHVITGDLNIRFDRPGDPSTLRATELLDAFGAVQCLAGVTQDRGGTFDVVITRVEDRPSIVDIITAPGRASDHRLVVWPFHAAQVETPVYRTHRRRSWRKFDVDQFRADLQSSCLCDDFINSSLGDDDSLGDDASVMASRLDEVVTALLDVHAPMTEITCRVRRSS